MSRRPFRLEYRWPKGSTRRWQWWGSYGTYEAAMKIIRSNADRYDLRITERP